MKTASLKAKGRRLVKEVIELYLKYAPELEAGDMEPVPSGVTGKDVWKSPAAMQAYPWVDECKLQEKWSLPQWIKQAGGHSTEYPWLLTFRRNHGKIYAVMEFEELLKIVKGSRSRGGA